MNRKEKYFAVALAMAMMAFIPGLTIAQDIHSKSVEKFVTNDVVGIFYLDLSKLDLDKTLEMAKSFRLHESHEIAELIEKLPALKNEIAELDKVGVSRVYALLRTSDIQSLGSSFVVPVDTPNTKNASSQVLNSFKKMAKAFGLNISNEIENPFNCWDAQPGVILVSKNTDQLIRLQKERQEQPRDLDAAWKALGNGVAGLIVFGDEDSRTVIDQLMPPLPSPLESITGKFVAEEIAWAGAEFRLGNQPNVKIVVESNSESGAKQVEETFFENEQVFKTTTRY